MLAEIILQQKPRIPNKSGHAWQKIPAWAFVLLLPCLAVSQPNITRVEWYVDTDPGYGNGKSININAGPNLTNLSFSVDVAPLTEGVHIVGVRSRDANGAWSQDNKWLFVKPYSINGSSVVPNINRVEWFVDNDPGYGKGEPISLSAGADLNGLSFSVNISPLTEGVHIVGVRSRDVNGSWSHDNKWLFVKPYSTNGNSPIPKITNVEWFVDTDPGYGNATPIAVTPAGNLTGLSFSVNIPPLYEGVHIVGVRSRDANGSWSHDNKWLFVKPYNVIAMQVPNITKVEWYLDNDPGYGNATQIAVSPGTNLSDLSFIQNISGLQPGVHLIGVRSKDANGAWSLDNKWLFINPFISSGARMITQIEYYIDTDPGYGKAVQLAVLPASNIPDKETIVNITGLTAGKHYLYFRSKDTTQAWSFDYRDSFNLAPPVPAPQIVINSSAKTTMCVRDSFNVGYDVTGTYNNNNTFKIFLSNAAGDFTAETEIGSKTATTDGLIKCFLPQNLPDGNGYKIRLKSSNPVLISAVPAYAFTLYDRPFFGNDTTLFAVCGTDLFDLNTIYPGTSFKLNWNTLNPDAADTGTYRLIAVNPNGCADTVNVTVKQDVGTWKGTTSSNWHTPGNWSNNHVPTAISHVIVPAGTPNKCVISASDAVAASIQVKPGAILNVTNNRKVNIAASCNALPN